MDVDRDRRTFLTAAAGTMMLAGVATAQENASGNATDAGGNATQDTGGGGEPETHTVEMITDGSTYLFDPVGLHVEPGDTVEWVLESGTHSATAYEDRIPEGAEAFDSGTLVEEGATFSHTFEVEGTYDYFCTPHKTLGMTARIVVGEPGGPASGSTPPDGIAEGEFPPEDAIVDQGSISYPYTADSGGGGEDGGGGGGAAAGGPTGFPTTVKTLGWGAIGAMVAALLGTYGLGRYGGEMNSAKATAILATAAGLGLLGAVTLRLVGVL